MKDTIDIKDTHLPVLEEIKLIINSSTLDEYEKYYFSLHPRASKKPITSPTHPSINSWMILKRPAMNGLKQKWKDFICWFVNYNGYDNLNISNCEAEFIAYYKTNRRHDIDNSVPKFMLDGFSESGMIVDDDSKHITKLTMQCFVDKTDPRTEITFKIMEYDKKDIGENYGK